MHVYTKLKGCNAKSAAEKLKQIFRKYLVRDFLQSQVFEVHSQAEPSKHSWTAGQQQHVCLCVLDTTTLTHVRHDEQVIRLQDTPKLNCMDFAPGNMVKKIHSQEVEN